MPSDEVMGPGWDQHERHRFNQLVASVGRKEEFRIQAALVGAKVR